MKLFFLRRVLGLAYIADGLMLFFGVGSAKFSLKAAKAAARESFRRFGVRGAKA